MQLSKMFELMYCLNLDTRPDRWRRSLKEFSKMNITPERFSAIVDDYPPIGCLNSHIAMLEKAQKENKNVFIFEDDVEFVDIENGLVEKALDELSEIEWDMFYLGGNILKPFYQETEHLAKLQHCQSTHAYGVNKKFLPELLHFLKTNIYFIDVLYANGVCPNKNCYITVPMVAIQRTDFSNIEKTKMSYDIPIERYNRFFVKLGEKHE